MRIDEINIEIERLAELESEVQGWGKYEGLSEQNGIKKSYINGFNKAKEYFYTKQDLIDLVESLKNYTKLKTTKLQKTLHTWQHFTTCYKIEHNYTNFTTHYIFDNSLHNFYKQRHDRTLQILSNLLKVCKTLHHCTQLYTTFFETVLQIYTRLYTIIFTKRNRQRGVEWCPRMSKGCWLHLWHATLIVSCKTLIQ